ncbi:MAG: hypothetical protein K2Q03_03505 [Sphingobacteriaceae bacterium]|nr:hypothetical protein [Sphingobacteriaceae bacterium]
MKQNQYFENYPKVNVFHFTSDGYAFENGEQANEHAKSLEDNTVKTVTRAEVETPKEESKKTSAKKGSDNLKLVQTKEEVGNQESADTKKEGAI